MSQRHRGTVNFVGVLKRLKESLWSSLLPIQCAGCGMWDETLCERCAQLAEASVDCRPLDVDAGVDDKWECLDTDSLCAEMSEREDTFPVLSLGEYDGALRRIILVAKHSNRQDLTDFLLECGHALGRACVESGLLRLRASQVVVVPAPPSWHRRLHGHSVTVPLARGVAQGIAAAGIYNETGVGARVSVIEAVGLRLGSRSQAGLTGKGRRLGREGAMRLHIRLPADACVVLVDDVVTTGATARELRRCLGAADVMVCLARAGK